MLRLRFRVLFGISISLIAFGTVFFHLVENWTWIDAYYFTVTTISTVGYGDLAPITPVGKIGATLLIFSGIGVFATALQMFGEKVVDRRVTNLSNRD